MTEGRPDADPPPADDARRAALMFAGRLPWLAVGLAIGLAGCVTSKTAEYVDPKTGQSYVCYRQMAMGVIPSVVAGNSYADCKNEFEGRGFIRRDKDKNP